jgi:hypothetical protein
MKRPWTYSFGWIIALVVMLVAGGTALGIVHAEHLLWWLLAFLAAAVVIG